jgi:Ras-related protein Rab-8A
MNNKPYDEMVKYILIGDSNVGKTSILRQFCHRKFNEREKSTVGLDYGERIISINDKNVLIQLWDTAGQERFRTLTPSYYRSAMGILLVYSVTDKSSFNSIEIWMKQIKQFAVENIPILILCNKADVKEKQVSEHQSRALSERHHVDLLMTSAKDNVNIETAIVRLYHRIDKEKRVVSSVGSLTHTIKRMTEDNKKPCQC